MTSLIQQQEVSGEFALRGEPRVSVIMPFLNLERFIEESIESVLAQTYASWELLLIDDGSTDQSTVIAKAYAERYPDRIRYFEHEGRENRGASATRNLGIRHARGEYLALLDADDVWLPYKLEQQVPLLDSLPSAGSLYGNTLWWYSWTGMPEDQRRDFMPRMGVPLNTLLAPPQLLVDSIKGQAAVPCTCSLLMRRSVVEQIGGFEEDFHLVFTDQAFYTKLFLAAPVYAADGCWDKYRRHDDSACSVVERTGQLEQKRVAYLHWFASYLARQQISNGELLESIQQELRWHARPVLYRTREKVRELRERGRLRTIRTVRELLPPSAHAWMWDRFPRWRQPSSDGLSFGGLHRLTPVSRRFGFDRGKPVDRYYIECFLSRHSLDVYGHVLEIGDDTYTRSFGGDRVSVSDVLHVTEGNPKATIIADLTDADHIQSGLYDCIILTQTLHYIFDMQQAVRTLYRILKPGGVCLATVPGISQLEEGPAWYWALTVRSSKRLFAETFSNEAVEVASHGNVLAACALLQGLASEELQSKELKYRDPSYPVLITIRAVKSSDPTD